MMRREGQFQVNPDPCQRGAEQQGLDHRATSPRRGIRWGIVVGAGCCGAGGDREPPEEQWRNRGSGDQDQRRSPIRRPGQQVGDQRSRQLEEHREGDNHSREEPPGPWLGRCDDGQRGGDHRRHPGCLERIAGEQELRRPRPASHEHPQRPHEQAAGVGQPRPAAVAEQGPREQEEGADRHLQGRERQGGSDQGVGA